MISESWYYRVRYWFGHGCARSRSWFDAEDFSKVSAIVALSVDQRREALDALTKADGTKRAPHGKI